MWEGYLQVGGQEILNAARVWGYTQTADCPISLLHDRPHSTIHVALGDDAPYTVTDMESAPWYDPDDPTTKRFYGAYPLDIVGLPDSTASADVTQRVGAGGVIGRSRESTRTVRVRAMLVAEGQDALEAGMTWLKAALAAENCIRKEVEIVEYGFGEGEFGEGGFGEGYEAERYVPIARASRDGLTDAMFLVAEPPEHGGDETAFEYRERVRALHRRMYRVKRVSGPLVESKRSVLGGRVFLYTVTFVLESELPWVYSDTTVLELPPAPPLVVQDAPFNLVTHPSAELSQGTAVVSTQYSTNPSVEVDATGWNVDVATISGSSVSPYVTQGRVVNELRAIGDASIRGRILGNGSTAASGRARIRIYNEVDVSGMPTGARMSFNIWGAIINLGGVNAFTVQSISAYAYWRTDTADISSTLFAVGTPADAGGKAYTGQSRAKPDAATRVRVAIEFVVDWASNAAAASNSDIRAYADAVAATMP